MQRSKSSIASRLPKVDLVNPRQTGQKREPIPVSYAHIPVQPTTPKSDVVNPIVAVKGMEWLAIRHNPAQLK